jgi:hypothetical protein
MSRHKGLLPASAPSEAIAVASSAGDKRALSAGRGSSGLFVSLLRIQTAVVEAPGPVPPPPPLGDVQDLGASRAGLGQHCEA